MILWDIVEKFKNYPDLFDLIIPDLTKLEPDMYYIIKVVRFFPNRQKHTRQYIWQQRFKSKKPILTPTLLENLEYKLKIKLKDL